MYLLLLSVIAALAGIGQTDSIAEPPYKRFPTIPPAKLLLTDSISYFTKEKLPKKKAVMLILFSPDCDHCQHETEEIIRRIDDFKKVQIVMATTLPFDKMTEYYKKYNLNRFPNIVVGKDVGYMLPTFYNVRNLPFLAFYNSKKELISVFEGALPIEKILEELKK